MARCWFLRVFRANRKKTCWIALFKQFLTISWRVTLILSSFTARSTKWGTVVRNQVTGKQILQHRAVSSARQRSHSCDADIIVACVEACFVISVVTRLVQFPHEDMTIMFEFVICATSKQSEMLLLPLPQNERNPILALFNRSYRLTTHTTTGPKSAIPCPHTQQLSLVNSSWQQMPSAATHTVTRNRPQSTLVKTQRSTMMRHLPRLLAVILRSKHLVPGLIETF